MIATHHNKGFYKIPKASKKKAKQLRDEAPIRAAIRERSNGFCEMRVQGVCTGHAQGVHHPLKQSQGGPLTLETGRAACSACNGFVERHPAAAREMGLSVGRFKE